MNKRGFTLIELIVVIAIIGVLVLIATPKFLNYTVEARETRIKHDIKVAENEVEIYLIKNETLPNSWGYVDGNILEQAKSDGKLYDRNGLVTDEIEGAFNIFTTPVYADEVFAGQYKEISNDFIDSKEKGKFYVSEANSKVYYVDMKVESTEPEIKEPEIVANDPTDFTYKSISEGIEITEYKGTSKDVVIPSMIDGKAVEIIGYNAFRGKQLTSVVIPDTITVIKNKAFDNNQLTSITIPDSVTSIDTAFTRNPSLATVIVEPGNQNYKSINNGIYTKDGTSLILGTKGMANNIENTINRIESGAFEGMGLTSVTIPNGVTFIGEYAFNNNQLTSVVMPDSLTFIGQQAFSFNQLKSINLNNVSTIMSDVFLNNDLTTVIIGHSVDLYSGAISITFETAYNSNGQSAGTYTSTLQTGTWAKQ